MEFKSFEYPFPQKVKLISEYNYYMDVNEAEDDNADDTDLNAPELEDDGEFDDLDAEIEGSGDEQPEGQEASELPADSEGLDGDIGDLNDNEVEIDVTDIVSKQDEMMAKYDEIISAINGLKANYGTDLKNIKQDINSITQKIDSTKISIEQELRKRVPTPNEKLELRSMSSYPYSTKLSDYWKPADEGNEYEFSIHNNSNNNYLDKAEKQNNEYILKMSDVHDGYNEYDIERSM